MNQRHKVRRDQYFCISIFSERQWREWLISEEIITENFGIEEEYTLHGM